jgi:uncharacterized protein YceK
MKRLIILTIATFAFGLSGCRAVESITKSKTGFWVSKCHPGIYLTDTPPNAAPGCEWHYEQFN